ncbi:hypothetical protein BJV82DRAFT_519426 [Fennellomyces sp. T-0311]|nr:hypothetical protein BJV82DRAFT_519426 [Fennellomyces sp. T-0311]
MPTVNGSPDSFPKSSPSATPPSTSSIPDTRTPYTIPTTAKTSLSEPFVAKPMTITISDPQKHAEAQGAFVSYLITTHTTLDTFSSARPRPVRRRFQDCVWLHNALMLEFPACIVPPLPEKHRLEYIKGDRFSSEFIERRRISLQWFLNRISRHPELQQSQCTRVFLESADFVRVIKKPDERFVDMKETVDKLEDNLNTVERLYSRIGKRQIDLQQDYNSFATSIQGLSAMETNIASQLNEFAETTQAYAKAMSEMNRDEDLLFLNDVHELLAYCHAAKATLRARDQKQVDFEELSAYHHRTAQERDRTKHPGRNLDGGLNISELVTDKINEVRGINMERARREKLARLDRKVKELESEVARANDESNAFSEQVIKEYEIFDQAKTEELKQGLVAYADSHIKFFETGVSVWESILPTLESMHIDDVDRDA